MPKITMQQQYQTPGTIGNTGSGTEAPTQDMSAPFYDPSVRPFYERARPGVPGSAASPSTPSGGVNGRIDTQMPGTPPWMPPTPTLDPNSGTGGGSPLEGTSGNPPAPPTYQQYETGGGSPREGMTTMPGTPPWMQQAPSLLGMGSKPALNSAPMMPSGMGGGMGPMSTAISSPMNSRRQQLAQMLSRYRGRGVR